MSAQGKPLSCLAEERWQYLTNQNKEKISSVLFSTLLFILVLYYISFIYIRRREDSFMGIDRGILLSKKVISRDKKD